MFWSSDSIHLFGHESKASFCSQNAKSQTTQEIVDQLGEAGAAPGAFFLLEADVALAQRFDGDEHVPACLGAQDIAQ